MQHSNSHTIKFILILTVIVSLLLSITSTQLKSLQEENIEIDRKKNLLKSIGLKVDNYSTQEIVNQYSSRIRELVIDGAGNVVNDINLDQLLTIENKATGEVNYTYDNLQYLPIYKSLNPRALIIPISGKGLWSTLYGYISLGDDYNTVKGITFYKHGETPGLGGEVEKGWFQSNFKGKKIFNNDRLVSIKVAKGRAIDSFNHEELPHAVDGISGATITSNGITNFLKRDLLRYENYFNKHK